VKEKFFLRAPETTGRDEYLAEQKSGENDRRNETARAHQAQGSAGAACAAGYEPAGSVLGVCRWCRVRGM
jgi:hypothetical protein